MECYRQLQSASGSRARPIADNGLPWPERTGEIRASKELFGRFNIDPGDTRGHIPLRPATHVQKQSSIA